MRSIDHKNGKWKTNTHLLLLLCRFIVCKTLKVKTQFGNGQNSEIMTDDKTYFGSTKIRGVRLIGH